MQSLPRTLSTLRVLSGAMVLAILVSGCGRGESGPRRYNVSGNVSFDGAPVPYGSILFQPDSAQGNSGPTGYATILDGKYSTAAGGKGIVGGPHQVVVFGQSGPPKQGVGNPDEPDENELFPQYTRTENFKQEDSTLNIEVPRKKSR